MRWKFGGSVSVSIASRCANTPSKRSSSVGLIAVITSPCGFRAAALPMSRARRRASGREGDARSPARSRPRPRARRPKRSGGRLDRMTWRSEPPFRADHVGSLLRPPALLEARGDYADGRLAADELQAVEDAAVRQAIRLQEEIGLQSA